MKMVFAILNSDDASTVMHNLMKEGYQITKLSTTGGFLRAGNVTVLIGVEDDKMRSTVWRSSRSIPRAANSSSPAAPRLASVLPLDAGGSGRRRRYHLRARCGAI